MLPLFPRERGLLRGSSVIWAESEFEDLTLHLTLSAPFLGRITVNVSVDLEPAGTLKAPTAMGAVEQGEGLEKDEKAAPHLIFLPEIKQAGPAHGGGGGLCPPGRLSPVLPGHQGWRGPRKDLGCLLFFLFISLFIHSSAHSLAPLAHQS